MRKTLGLFSLIILLISCSSDNESSEENDSRYKLIFDFRGFGTIIGDNSNKVLKRFELNNQFLTLLGYYKNEQSDELFLATRETLNSGYIISKLFPVDILNTTDFYYSSIPFIEIPFELDENLISFEFISENQCFLLVSNNDELIYKRYNSESIVETKNLTLDFNITPSSLNGIVYSKDLNELIILNEIFPDFSTQINRFNLNNWSLTVPELTFNSNLFGSFSNNNEVFMIGKKEINFEIFEYLYDSDGNIISQTNDTFNFLNGSAIGYDKIDERYEYIHRSDGRNEVGIINIQTGELEKRGIIGEPGFHSSILIFFNE